MQFPKPTKEDWLSIAALVIFVVLAAIPVYTDKGDCEVARAGYKCASAKDVILENCNYWAQFECDVSRDNSLPQIEWYIGGLCNTAKKKIPSLDCPGTLTKDNLAENQQKVRNICNTIVQSQLCPAG